MELKIGNKSITYFNEYEINMYYNTVASTFSFSIYFDPENPEHKDLLQPLKYKTCTVWHKNELLITGTILNHNFSSQPVKQLVSISGYSITGVIENCEIPIPLTLQTLGLTTLEIARRLLQPFNLNVIADQSAIQSISVPHSSSTANRDESIRSYLTSITAQSDIVLSHTPDGSLLFTKAKTIQKPILVLTKGIPGTELNLSINGEQMHSRITVMKQANLEGGNAGQSSVDNPFVTSFRPTVKVQSSGNDNSTIKAAKNILANEIKSSINLTVNTDRWELDGKIIRPNNIIVVEDPELYLYNKVNWFVNNVTLSKTVESETAVLGCVLPCVYDGTTPINIFK